MKQISHERKWIQARTFRAFKIGMWIAAIYISLLVIIGLVVFEII